MSCVCRPHLPGKDRGEAETAEMRRILGPKKQDLLACQELSLIREDIGGLGKHTVMLINKTSNFK